jgi:predicted RNA methylase
MRLKHLESALCSVPVQRFPSPNITLEQYATSPNLTANVIISAFNNGDLGPGCSALDLGCGTGMLTIGSALIGCNTVISFDCDESALSIARENVEAMELEVHDEDDEDYGCKVQFILGRVHHHCEKPSKSNQRARSNPNSSSHKGGRRRPPAKHQPQPTINDNDCDDKEDENINDGIPLQSKCVDTVLTNPPFGTKHNEGIDVTFLKAATRLARKSVYSFHKSSTRPYLQKIVKQWGYEVQVVAQMKFDIPNSYKFHKKKSVDVDVDLIRVILS